MLEFYRQDINSNFGNALLGSFHDEHTAWAEPEVNQGLDLSVYREALLFLVTAGVVAPLFFRLRVSPVLGYLLAGIALGPYGLGRLTDKAPWLNAFAINVEAIDRIAAFGVVFLLFTMGLELSFERCGACASGVRPRARAGRRHELILAGVALALGRAPPPLWRRGGAGDVSTAMSSGVGREQTAHSAAGRATWRCSCFRISRSPLSL